MENSKIKLTWQKIYKEWFNLEKDFSNLEIPSIYNNRKHFAVIVAEEINMSLVGEAIKKEFKIWVHNEDLDVSGIKNDRDSKKGDYVVFFKKNIEADEEFKDLSANKLAETGHKGITLLERLLLEVLYFNETKKHLDIKNVTICTGSRGFCGRVPRVFWNSGHGKLRVDWNYPDSAGDNLRSRAVVYF